MFAFNYVLTRTVSSILNEGHQVIKHYSSSENLEIRHIVYGLGIDCIFHSITIPASKTHVTCTPIRTHSARHEKTPKYLPQVMSKGNFL